MAVWNSPTMVADNAPSPYVVSVEEGSFGQAYLCMDANPATYGGGYATWWKIDVGAAGVCIQAATIKNYSPYGMNAFKIQGSANGTTWVDIYSGSCADNSNVQSFSFTLSNVYRYFRILVSTFYNPPYLMIYEITLSGYTTPPLYNYLHARRDRMNMKGVSSQNSLAE